ncbi:MAG: recombinase family protein [Pseudomonadota bacterium]
MKAAIYTRVSTTEQKEEGTSLQTQRERCEQFAASQGWTVAGVYTDDQSGKDLDRPDMRRLLADWRRGLFDVVVVYRLDRLTRSSRDLEVLLQLTEETGRGFKSVAESFIDTTTPMGRMVCRLIITFAGYEREVILERTRGGLERRVKEGHQHGTAPFGYRKGADGRLVVEPDEAAKVRQAFDLYRRGHGCAEIERLVPGVPRVRAMLRNPVYTGRVRFAGLEADGGHEPIIGPEEFAEVRAILRERRRASGDARARFLLSGILVCGRCGGKLYGARAGKYAYYTCENRRGEAGRHVPYLPVAETDRRVLQAIADALDPEKVRAVVERRVREATAENASRRRELDRLRQQEQGVVARRQRWYAAFEEGDITGAQLHDRLAELDGRLAAIQAEARRLEAMLDSSDPRPAIERAVDAARRLADSFAELPPKEARSLIRQVVGRAVVRGRWDIELDLFKL